MEFQTAPYTIIDGRPVNGRSVGREDGSYESYDLADAKPGHTFNVTNTEGEVYELVKVDEHGGTLEGWWQCKFITVGPDNEGPERLERSLGRAVRIVPLLHNPHGTPIRTSTRVIREKHHELGIVPIDPDREAILHSLGVVARISGDQLASAGLVNEGKDRNMRTLG
jgi:hypothetical protein